MAAKRHHEHSLGAASRARDGWAWFVAGTLARAYLATTAALLACALLPAAFGWQGNVIRSGSMEPHIGVGDIVVTAELPDSSPVPVGRVVSFINPAAADGTGQNTIRMHRIVGDNQDGTFITAGDANPQPDSTAITRDQITGQARLLIPWVGKPVIWLRAGDYAPLALWLLLSMAAVVLAGLRVPGRRRDDHDDHEGRTGSAGEPAEPVRELSAVARHRRGAFAARTASTLFVVATAAVLPVAGANAAFTDRTSNIGNTFAVATNASTARSTYQISESPGSDGWINESSAYVWLFATSGSGTPTITYRLNAGSAVSVRSNAVRVTVSQQGDNTLTYFATDNLGRAENQHTVRVKLDSISPAVAITSRVTNSTHAQWRASCPSGGATGAFCGTVTDTASGVDGLVFTLTRRSDNRCFDGRIWTTTACNTEHPVTVSDGQWAVPVPDATLPTARTSYTFTVSAVDVAGNQSVEVTRTFSIG